MVGILSAGNVDSPELFIEDDVTSIHGLTSGLTIEVESFLLLKSDALGRVRKWRCFISRSECCQIR